MYLRIYVLECTSFKILSHLTHVYEIKYGRYVNHNRKFLILTDGNTLLTIIYNKPTRYNSGSIAFIKNYKYALHVSDALCFHLQEHYKL